MLIKKNHKINCLQKSIIYDEQVFFVLLYFQSRTPLVIILKAEGIPVLYCISAKGA